MKHIVFVLLSFFSLLVYAEDENLLLSGTLGNSKVVFELNTSGEEVSGNYYYEKTGINIPFSGTVSDNRLSFYAGSLSEEDNAKKKYFQLIRTGDQFKGTCKYNDKTFEIELTEVDILNIENVYAESNFRFYTELSRMGYIEQLRTNLAVFEQLDSFTVRNNITLQWFRETKSKTLLFRVVKGLPQDAITFVNDLLETIQLIAFSEYGSCGMGQGNPEYSNDIIRYFINKDFFSIEFETYFFCGGVHPEFSKTIYNLDLNILMDLHTEDLLQFPGFVKLDEFNENLDDWSNYRINIFGPKINDYFKIAYSDEMSDEEISGEDGEMPEYTEEKCVYDNPDLWAYQELLITENGFWIGTLFPGYERLCNDPEWSIIPFNAFENYVNPPYKKQLAAIGN